MQRAGSSHDVKSCTATPYSGSAEVCIAHASSAGGRPGDVLVSYEPAEFSLVGKRLSAQTSLQMENKKA